jgi:hypothetical protein
MLTMTADLLVSTDSNRTLRSQSASSLTRTGGRKVSRLVFLGCRYQSIIPIVPITRKQFSSRIARRDLSPQFFQLGFKKVVGDDQRIQPTGEIMKMTIERAATADGWSEDIRWEDICRACMRPAPLSCAP